MKQPEKYFLYVGNAYPHKNLQKLIEAFSSFRVPKFKSLKLILVGPDDYFYQKLKERAQRMGLTDQIIFHGPATKEELTGLYKNALALIFPSLMEGFGLPAVEAMANNCLVLCSNIPVFHEILKDTAVYFNPNDPKDMAEKMEDVAENQEKYQSLKLKGLKVIENYSWQKLARETLQIYRAVNSLQ